MIILYDNSTLLLILWTLCGLIGMMLGKAKGRAGAGLAWGFLAGPLGWLAVIGGPDKRSKCPACGGAIPDGAVKCRHCGSDVYAAFKRSVGMRDKQPAEPTADCPHCSAPIRVSSLHAGSNVCPACGETFDVTG